MTGKIIMNTSIRYRIEIKFYYTNIKDRFFFLIEFFFHSDGERLGSRTVVDITGTGSKVKDMAMERRRRTFSKKKKQRHFLITIFSKNNAI